MMTTIATNTATSSWAYCLAQLEEDREGEHWPKIQRLLSFCPSITSTPESKECMAAAYNSAHTLRVHLSGNGGSTYPMDTCSGSDALLALAGFVKIARIQRYHPILVPLLLSHAIQLPTIAWRDKSVCEAFTTDLVDSILQICESVPSQKAMIMKTLRECCVAYSHHRRHLAGFICAIARHEALIAENDEWKMILLQLLSQYTRTKRPRICGLILCALRAVVPLMSQQELQQLHRQHIVPIIKRSQSLDTTKKKRADKVRLLLQALDLTALVCAHCSALKHETLKLCTAVLVHTIDKGCGGDAWSGWVEIGQAALHSIERVCMTYNDLIVGVVSDLSGMLLHSRRLLRHAHEQEMREAITNCFATLLRHDLGAVATNYATSVTRKVVFSLLNSLYKDFVDTDTRRGSAAGGGDDDNQHHLVAATPKAFVGSTTDVFENQLSEERIQQNALRLIGALTHLLDSTHVTKDALPVLSQRFLERPKALHVVVPHLTQVAFSGGDELPFFNEISQMLITTYHRPNSPDNKYNIQEISDAFSVMAECLVSDHKYFMWRYVLLRNLLKLFSELGAEINEQSAHGDAGGVTETSMLGVPAILLPALATLMMQDDDDDNGMNARNLYYDLDRGDVDDTLGVNVFANTDNNVSWFIRVWFLFTLYDFTAQRWPDDWLIAIRQIARHTPVLVSQSSNKSFVGGMDSIVSRLGTSRSQLSRVKKRLQRLFPDTALTANISDCCCVYVLSVYQLEHLRVESRVGGYFYGVFEYLRADSLDGTEVMPMMCAIADRVFNDFLEYTSDKEQVYTLPQQAIFLINQLTSRYALVREKAHKYLMLLSARHKYIQWSESCVKAILDHIDVLTTAVAHPEGLSNERPQLNARRSVRADILQQMQTLAVSWIRNAQFIVPDRIESVLQNFAVTTHPSNAGIALALNVSPQSISRLLCGASQKERYLGEITGLCAKTSRAELLAELTRDMSATMAQFTSATMADKTIMNTLEGRLEAMITRAAALLIHSSNSNSSVSMNSTSRHDDDDDDDGADDDSDVESREILHLIVKVPVKVFTARTMKAAVFVWEWILSTCASQQLPLLMEIKAAWAYAVDRGKGLFSNQNEAFYVDRRKAALHSDMNAPIHDDMERFVAHSTWISFLFQRFIPVTGCHRDQLNALTMMLHKAFARPELLSTERNAFAPRFQLILLGLKVLQQDTIRLELRDRRLLRGRLYHAAFQWFFIEPYWLNPSKASGDNDTELVISVCKALQNEDQYWDGVYGGSGGSNRSSSGGGGGSNDNGSGYAVYGSVDNLSTAASVSTVLSAPSSMQRSTSQHTRSVSIHSYSQKQTASIVDQRVRSSTVVYSGAAIAAAAAISGINTGSGSGGVGATADATRAHSEDSVSIMMNVNHSESRKQERVQRFRALLYFLMCHECDRMSLWAQPSRPQKKLSNDQRVYTTSRIVSNREWRQFMRTAWMVDVRLAVMLLTKRFPSQKPLRDTLQQLIIAHPEAVYHVPSAVMFLIDSGRDDLLHHLIYWAPCELYDALKLLLPPYVSNQAINEYVVHSLRCHSFDEVMFYLPQLIQCVRHDARRLLRQYMVEATQSSILLAHQLVWMCEAELGTESADIAVDYDDPHRLSIQGLISDIIASFGASEADYFRAQFTFFERITRISGVLKPIEVVGDRALTKEKRKQRIREELERIPVDERAQLYLPTNPSDELVSIICTSGTPMQSAAKVPILVAFKCRRTAMVKRCPSDLDSVRSYLHALDATTPDGDETKDDDEDDGHGEGAGDDNGVEMDTLTASKHGASAPMLDMPEFDGPSDHHTTTSSTTTTSSQQQQQQQQIQSGSIDDIRPVYPRACIFKVGDDVRQDALALQIIRLCKRIWHSVGLDLFVYPYAVLPNRINDLIGGVIECVPNAQTRDEIGKATACSLKDHFVIMFGREEGVAYQEAQRNFILSLAGYAIVSYLLQAKDRHNGNLMIDNQGHVIHIDFGFIFDISPGHDMKFERAGFKLTLEMVEIMGGNSDAPLYKWFTQLIIRGFLAVREHQDQIISLVHTMTVSDLACFKPHSVENLRARLFPDKDEMGAAAAIKGIISEAYNNFRTNMYDYIQNMQQNIYYWRGYPGDAPQ